VRWFVPAALLVAATVTGCATDSANSIADYRRATTLPPLELPPDLTQAAATPLALPVTEPTTLMQREPADGAQVATAGSSVLPQFANARLLGDGHNRWLLIDAPVEQVWPVARSFWEQNGFELKRNDPAIGLLETQWTENRADIPQGPIRRFIGKVLDALYSAPTRDKFRLRVERGSDPETTELYLSHYGVEEMYDESGASDRGYWRSRPADPELVAEMQRRLLIHFGVPEQRSRTLLANSEQQPLRAQYATTAAGAPEVVVSEPFARTWRRTGVALERLGLVVEDRDRSAGLYHLRGFDAVTDANGGKGGGFFSWLRGIGDTAVDTTPLTLQVEASGGDSCRLRIMPTADNGADPRAEKLLQQLALELQ